MARRKLGDGRERPVELHGERVRAVHPAAAANRSRDTRPTVQAHVARDDLLERVAADTVLAVDQKLGGAVLPVDEAVDGRVVRSSHLGLHVEVVERDGVVARLRGLGLLPEHAAEIVRAAGPGERLEPHVAEVGHASAADVRL